MSAFLMCRPTHYTIAYEINPWMSLKRQANRARALAQWTRLHQLLTRQLGARISVGSSFLVASGTPLSEYGGVLAGPPYWGFATTRGTAGRTPAIWDLAVRGSYELPIGDRAGFRARALLDLQHLGSPRRIVDYDQVHFTCAANDPSCANASYGTPTRYQPPMAGRLGLLVDF